MARVKRKQDGTSGAKSAERGFYSRALDEADKLDFQLARGVEGIDDEIALLRMTIRSLLESDPDNVKLILEATNALARLVRTRYRISSEQKQALSSAIGSVLQNLAVPLGIRYLP